MASLSPGRGLRCRNSDGRRLPSRSACKITEHPFRIARLLRKRRIDVLEIAFLQRLRIRETVYTGNTAIRRIDDAPLRFAGDRIGVKLTQIPLDALLPCVFDQI